MRNSDQGQSTTDRCANIDIGVGSHRSSRFFSRDFSALIFFSVRLDQSQASSERRQRQQQPNAWNGHQRQTMTKCDRAGQISRRVDQQSATTSLPLRSLAPPLPRRCSRLIAARRRSLAHELASHLSARTVHASPLAPPFSSPTRPPQLPPPPPPPPFPPPHADSHQEARWSEGGILSRAK